MEMRDYILEQPAVYKDILARRAQIAASFVEYFAATDPDQVYLVGSGTSLNGCMAAAPFMEYVLDMPVRAHAAIDLPVLHGGKPLFIYVSQGGASTNTIRAIKTLKDYPSFSITGEVSAPINDLTEKWQMLEVGEEKAGPKTKGYTGTILELYVFALEAALKTGRITAERADEILAVLMKAGDLMEENIRRTLEWYETNRELLRTWKTVFMAGKQLDGIVAREAGLKVMETFLIPVISYDFEEALHGPASCMDNSLGGMYLVPTEDDEDAERVKGLARFHRMRSAAVFTVGFGEFEDPRDLSLVGTGLWYTAPFEKILPAQVASACIPALIGVDKAEGHRRFAGLDEMLHTKQH